MLKISTLLSGLLLLAGCAQISPKQLQAMQDRKFQFSAPVSFEDAYQKILQQEKSCWEESIMGGTQIIANGNIYSETHTAEITLYVRGITGTNTLHLIDLQATSQNETQITGWAKNGKVENYQGLVKSWILTNSTSCDLSNLH